ncbi:hypothetical protein MMC22_010553 [Lobaria immixta]|nr:hypothetical protein [Lobaria immixta]
MPLHWLSWVSLWQFCIRSVYEIDHKDIQTCLLHWSFRTLFRPSCVLYSLFGLCRRRQWPEPHYEFYGSRAGFACVARVNNREYQTDTTYGSELLARENAAMRAYLICRNFSVNDGMYPSGHNKGAVLQGLPVAIGTERRSVYTEDLDTSTSSGSRSGGSSPRCYDSTKVYGGSRRSSTAGRGPRYGGRQY